MFLSRLVFLSEDDPWTYLDPRSIATQIEANIEMNGSFWSSLYVTLRLIGISGTIITLAIAFAKLAFAGPEKRNELKDTIFKKLIGLFLLFASAYILGTIIGVFTLL